VELLPDRWLPLAFPSKLTISNITFTAICPSLEKQFVTIRYFHTSAWSRLCLRATHTEEVKRCLSLQVDDSLPEVEESRRWDSDAAVGYSYCQVIEDADYCEKRSGTQRGLMFWRVFATLNQTHQSVYEVWRCDGGWKSYLQFMVLLHPTHSNVFTTSTV